MKKQDKIKKVMREFKNRKLKTPNGEIVTDKKQALAIAMSESEDYTEKADLIEDISISSLSHAEDIIKSIDNEELFEKGIYSDTSENRKLGRVGQEYHKDKTNTEVRKAVDDEMGISDAYRELFGEDLEKAHQDGDIHPKHPDWVWVSSASGGKGDWRKLNGRSHKKHQETNGKKGNEQPQTKTIADHASETKTETLQKVVNSNASAKLKQAAQKELKKREDSRKKSETQAPQGSQSGQKKNVDDGNDGSSGKKEDEKKQKYDIKALTVNDTEEQREVMRKYSVNLYGFADNSLECRIESKKDVGGLKKFLKDCGLKFNSEKLFRIKNGQGIYHYEYDLSDVIGKVSPNIRAEIQIKRRKDILKKIVSPDSTTENAHVQKLIDTYKISDNSYTDTSKMSIVITPKGNWNLRYDGKDVSTISGQRNIMDRKTLEAAGIKFEESKKRPVGAGTNGPTPKTKADKTASKQHSAFVTKTINKLKEALKYRDISDEHLKKLADAMEKDEATAKKIAGVKFPTVGTVGPGISYDETTSTTPISSNDELVCHVSKSYITTSRGSSPYTSTKYTIYLKDRYSGIKKQLSFSSSSTHRYGKTASKAKQECVMEALMSYYKNSL